MIRLKPPGAEAWQDWNLRRDGGGRAQQSFRPPSPQSWGRRGANRSESEQARTRYRVGFAGESAAAQGFARGDADPHRGELGRLVRVCEPAAPRALDW